MMHNIVYIRSNKCRYGLQMANIVVLINYDMMPRDGVIRELLLLVGCITPIVKHGFYDAFVNAAIYTCYKVDRSMI